MRYGNLSLFLGLLWAWGCASDRTRPEPAAPVTQEQGVNTPPQSAQSPATTDGATAKPESNAEASGARKDAVPTAVGHDQKPEAHDIEVLDEKYDNGVVRKRVEGYRNAEGEFVPHGLSTTWYDSGFKWTETPFKDGVKHGQQRKWFNTGAESSEGSYDDGLEDGVWTAYHPNGEKAREIHIDHGIWNGPYTEYHDNGRKNMEVIFVHGLRQGVSTVWNEDGSVAYVTDYIDGVEQP